MDKNLFRYIWRHSRRDQLVICGVVLLSLPFYFASLDLPRMIVNQAIQGKAFENGHSTATFLRLSLSWPGWLGGGSVQLFEGFQVDRFGLLFGLSGLFLLFVLVNGAFKYWINLSKGSLGERMLRRMRFELFSLVLRFTPETFRHVKASETATIIKDEVEPIGGFIGDAFILPAFLGTQAATALAFIILQNMALGLMAAAVVGVQFVVIPRLRRELLRLGRRRQLTSRRLAGRIAEVVDGIEAIHVHNTGRWERADIGQRLFELFDIRLRIYNRKFVVKFLNNLLAQMTPFLFYCIGGYFALKGRLDIGQLVAVVAAYRDLPPPLKELIDWDQQRLDVQVKYEQVVQQFSPERLLPEDSSSDVPPDLHLEGPLVVEKLQVVDAFGSPVIEDGSFTCELPARIAIASDAGPASGLLARMLAHRWQDYSGTIRLGNRNFAEIPKVLLGRRLAFAGVEPNLFPGSLRDNIVYGLRQAPVRGAGNDPERTRRIAEARRTGNPGDSIQDDWLDCGLAGARDEDELDAIILHLLEGFGLDEDVYRFGLSGMVIPAKQPMLAERMIEARVRLRQRLVDAGMAGLVEPFDEARYNSQATVAENLLFGVPTSRDLLTGRGLAHHPGFREALDREGLTLDLVGMGVRIAETMTEIFRGLPAGHPLFEQFSFIAADELADYEDLLRRYAARPAARARGEDRSRLLALPLSYVEPRHRLGLLTPALRDRLVAARGPVRASLERRGDPGVEFYDPERVCAAAPLRDNLLFGRIDGSAANAQVQVNEAIAAVVDELELRTSIERVGLGHQVGPAGRVLTAAQRAGVDVVRCLLKRPDIFVLDGALAPFGESRARSLLEFVLAQSSGRTVFATIAAEQDLDRFDAVIRVEDKRLVLEKPERVAPGEREQRFDPVPERRLAGVAR